MKELTRLDRKTAVGMDELVRMYIREMKISTGLNTQRIFDTWDQVSGASTYTIKKFFRDGKLYITLNSSVVRNQLYFQKDSLIMKINSALLADPLFCADAPRASVVNELILK